MQAKSLAEERQEKAVQARNEFAQLLYVSDIAVAWQAWKENNVVRVRDLLERHRPKAAAGAVSTLRGSVWNSMMGLFV